HGPCPAAGDPAPVVVHQGCAGEYGPHHGRGRVWRRAGTATPANGPEASLGPARLASSRRIQPAPDVTLLGLLESDRGDSVGPERESRRNGSYHPYHGEQGRVRADCGVRVWLATALDGAHVCAARLGGGSLPQTARAHVGLLGRHGLLRAAGLALSWPRPAPG